MATTHQNKIVRRRAYNNIKRGFKLFHSSVMAIKDLPEEDALWVIRKLRKFEVQMGIMANNLDKVDLPFDKEADAPTPDDLPF